ncbi:hypothetical protein DZB84_13345 [Bacillus sp. HNG]|uniref:hypothetical protein n=1 Tax=Bacillus sp. HNG TaxID=2293325 RepID=UPI000E2E80D7|nr:hypothetical protein [Bacillus sp. HNG]RFB15383.1 hypothetical protein DZB84_13345 [Bacillus sp. HNG]
MNHCIPIIKTSQELFSDLLKILVPLNNGELNYQISEIRYVLQLMEHCIENKYEDSQITLDEIKIVHQKIYPPRGGLSDFFIWHPVYEERVRLNEPFEKISYGLWKLLQQNA